MRIGLEEMPVLEGARLAFVGVDRHQARALLAQHGFPLARGREARAAAAAQARLVDDVDQLLARERAAAQALKRLVAAVGTIGVEVLVGGDLGMMPMLADRLRHRRHVGMVDEVMPDLGDRRGMTMADAGRAHDTHVRAGRRLQIGDQLFRAGEIARQALADPNGNGWWRGLALLHHVEMRIEGRDLVDLGLRHLHLIRQRHQMGWRRCGRIRPGSGAGTRSAGRADAGHRPAGLARHSGPTGISAGPSGSCGRGAGSSRDGVADGLALILQARRLRLVIFFNDRRRTSP